MATRRATWCAGCHEDRFNEFKKGKHAAAWAAMKAMPTIHWQPMELTEGMKGCGGCHKIGLKDAETIAADYRFLDVTDTLSLAACASQIFDAVSEPPQRSGRPRRSWRSRSPARGCCAARSWRICRSR